MAKLIPLTKGYSAIVDDEDYEWLNVFKWRAAVKPHTIYAIRRVVVNGKETSIAMHREVIAGVNGMAIDHINANGLDNRKGNLRFASSSSNSANRRKRRDETTSQFKGVTWHKQCRKWQCQIEIHGKPVYLGVHATEHAAAIAYDAAAIKFFGGFANTNGANARP